MMQDGRNVRRLDPFKKLKFEDILEFTHKTNKIITYKFLRKNGFDPNDIDIIYENNELKVLKNNCRVFEQHVKILSKQIKEKSDRIIKTVKTIVKVEKEIQNKPEYIKLDKYWSVTNHYKSGINKRKIYNDKINELYQIIKKNTTKNNMIVSYLDIVAQLIIKNKLYNVTVDSFNGGRNRSIYFELFYYPSKVLDHLGKIKRFPGKIERLLKK